MEKPEPDSRHGIVVVRITPVEKAKNLLVNEIEPQEAVVFARAAVKGKREVRRVPQCCQDVPGCGDQKSDKESADGPKPLPGAPHKKLSGEEKIDKRGGTGENNRD